MGGTQATEAPTLHGAGKALTNGVTGDIDQLTSDEVFSGDKRADRKQALFILDAEFCNLLLQTDFGLGESFALRLVDVLLLGPACADLNREIAVAIGCAVGSNLALFQRQNGDRHVPTVLLEEAGHPDFLRDHASAHDPNSLQRHKGTIPRCVPSPDARSEPRPG